MSSEDGLTGWESLTGCEQDGFGGLGASQQVNPGSSFSSFPRPFLVPVDISKLYKYSFF